MNLNKYLLIGTLSVIATNAFATGQNIMTSKSYVDAQDALKQDVITTGNVLFYDDNENGVYNAGYDLQVPGLVAYDATTGELSGTKIGILDHETVLDDEGGLHLYSYNGGGYGAEMDNFVPTVRAVAEALQDIWNNMPSTSGLQTKIPARATKIRQDDATFAPSVVTNTTTEGTVGQMAIITDAKMHEDDWGWDDYVNSDNLIPTLAVVGNEAERIVSAKQNKISGHANNVADSILTDSATDGVVQKRSIYNDTAANYNSSTQSTYIPTMGAVMSAVSAGLPTGTANTIANYDANGDLGTGIATANAPAYTSGSLTNGTNIATIAAVDTREAKMTCAGWPESVAVADRTDANCWLWQRN